MLDELDLTLIHDEGIRQCILMLLDLVEDLKQENYALREENQRLRDEINRLKGEQGKPIIKPGTKPAPATKADHSSERERHRPKVRIKGSKLDQITVDREEVLLLDRSSLPPDAEFKGYEPVVVQDICIKSDNVLFRKEKFYSPSQQKSYLAALPKGYSGQFGPGIKALVLVFYFGARMSEAKVAEFLHNVGVKISEGQVSKLLIKDQEGFHKEKDALYQAGLASSPWQHLDETSTRVNGQNGYCHIVCNPLYTAYFTTESKDRLTVIDVLRNKRPRRFLVNEEALGYLETLGLSELRRRQLLALPQDVMMDEATIEALLEGLRLGPQQRKWVLEATAVAAYHRELEFPVVRLLVCDDAPQFALVTQELALCWVHEGRLYKKLLPYVAAHRRMLDEFLKRFWEYYDQLLSYREQPRPQEAARLGSEFDALFSTVTGYRALDERIALTLEKKPELLMVLTHPEIPLHNNPAELGARARVRKRDVSFGPRTQDGAKAWDSFMSLAETARKLGVSFYHYIHDRISGTGQIPQLSSIIEARAKELDLGTSWAPP
jgi:hypothetical protein